MKTVERGIYKRDGMFEVRWREGGRNRSRRFSKLTDARAWRDETRRRKQMGGMSHLLPVNLTLTEFTRRWLETKIPDLSPNTVRGYDFLLNRHVLPFLGSFQLSELRPRVIAQWQEERLADGCGRRSIAQAQALLSTICRAAVARELMQSNPCDPIAAPKRARKSVIPLNPYEVEMIRDHMFSEDQVAEATLVSVMAYAGLRPSEAFALTWEDLANDRIRVTKKVVEGEVVPYTKTQVPRSVTIRGPLQGDLVELGILQDYPTDKKLIFPRPDGLPMTRTDIGNFRRRVFAPARIAANRPDATPYHLRHSFASMLITEGELSLPEVAAECGHDLATLVKNYAHIVQGARTNVSFAEQVRDAREQITKSQAVA
jgi:integrase